jgi:hypothetical protein
MRRAFAVLAALMLAGVVLVSPAPASVSKPDCFEVEFQQACTFPADEDFTDTVLCAFPVEVHVTGLIRYRPVFASDGSDTLTRETFKFHFRATITNPTTGRFFTDPSDFVRRRTFLADGTIRLREAGRFHDARMDDGQRLFHQSGIHMALLSPDEQVIPGTEVFRGNFESEAAFPGKVCPLLAQPR